MILNKLVYLQMTIALQPYACIFCHGNMDNIDTESPAASPTRTVQLQNSLKSSKIH